MNKKIVIIGTSCSGKTTLSKQIAVKLKIQHHELDNYFWSNNWIAIPEKEFIALVQEILNNNSNWVICGNYSNVRKALWDKSTDIIWLDYPFYLVFFRAIKRSIIRIYKKEKVCNNNIESF
jgi:adenylate kinase family enzyme